MEALSPLPVTVIFQCDAPFSIIDGDRPSHDCKVWPEAWHPLVSDAKVISKKRTVCLILTFSFVMTVLITHTHTHAACFETRKLVLGDDSV